MLTSSSFVCSKFISMSALCECYEKLTSVAVINAEIMHLHIKKTGIGMLTPFVYIDLLLIAVDECTLETVKPRFPTA
jgi:hypothetical protein